MSEFVALLKKVKRTKAVEYSYAFLMTMERSEAIGYLVAFVAIVLLTIALT